MAPPARTQQLQPKPLAVPKQLKVQHPENEALSRFFLDKWRSMMKPQQQPGGGPPSDSGNDFVLSENNYLALAKANRNLCAAKEPIRTLKDFSKIKGVGQWIIRVMKDFFPESSQDLSPTKGNAAAESGKKTSGSKTYVPRKNTAACAMLITLHREMISGKKYMLKQELIDATEASGLSQGAIGPDKYKGKHNSPKDWYTGWSCMKTLESHGLVVKSCKPLRYMLTEEGHNTARECISRAGLGDSAGPLGIASAHNTSPASHISDHRRMGPSGAETMSRPSATIRRSTTSVSSHPPDVVCGSSATKISLAYNAQVQTTNNCSRKIILSDSDSNSEEPYELQTSTTLGSREFKMLDRDPVAVDSSVLAMPPRQFNESFLEAYEVVLILDDRESFGTRSRKVADNIYSQFGINVEFKHLPVGDGIWIARHKRLQKEYVLDFIVERKNVADFGDSIRDNRYRVQKLRMKRCGLTKLIYLVEGDPNDSDASEKIETACLTTEILDGFVFRGPEVMLILKGDMAIFHVS